MSGKLRSKLCSACTAVLLAGFIIAVIGIYYLIFKAGIPYQDPTTEMQIQYAINYGIGDTLFSTGLITAIIGGVPRAILWFMRKK